MNDTSLRTVLHRVKPELSRGISNFKGKVFNDWCYAKDRKSMLLSFDGGHVCIELDDEHVYHYTYTIQNDQFHLSELVRVGFITQERADEQLAAQAAIAKHIERQRLINMLAASDPLTPDELILIDAKRRNSTK